MKKRYRVIFYNTMIILGRIIMRPKNSYTPEEYNSLKEEVINLKNKLCITQEQLKNEKYINRILTQKDNGKSYEYIKLIIAEEEERRRMKEKWAKHAYYIEIKQYVEMGITDMKQIALLVGKSYSSVRRALQEMNMYPLKEQKINNMKLSI